jgi:hypothetical protein
MPNPTPGKLVEDGLAGMAAGGVSAALLALSRDLLISVAVATLKAFRRPTTPPRLLSRVDDLAGRRIGSSYVPQWGALTGPSCTEPTFNSSTDQYKKWLYWPQKTSTIWR